MPRRSRTNNTTVVVGEKRAARRSRRGYGGRRNRGGFGIRITPEWLLGFVGAFAVPQNPLIDGIAMVGACAPVKGLGKSRGVAMGYTCGQATQHLLLPQAGINIPDFLAGRIGASSGNAGGEYI